MRPATRILAAVLVALLIAGAFSVGVYLGGGGPGAGADPEPRSVALPVWETGRFWYYAFDTPDIDPTMARIVVATKNETQYQLGIDNRLDAQRHAVLNYNPMLGRITTSQLAVFEKGVPQTILLFPLHKGKIWNFTLLGRENWIAKVTGLDGVNMPGENRTTVAVIEASAGTGDVLKCTYDTSAGWFRSMVLLDASGREELRMTLVSSGTGYKGDAYFVRGVDLYSKDASSSTGSPEVDVYESFIDRGHPTWGPFDSLIYYYTVKIGDRSNGVLTFRDHSTTTLMRKTFDPGTEEDSIGSMPSSGGEVGVTIALQGSCRLRVMVAGGIEYKWTL
jgi:hypothetical protein